MTRAAERGRPASRTIIACPALPIRRAACLTVSRVVAPLEPELEGDAGSFDRPGDGERCRQVSEEGLLGRTSGCRGRSRPDEVGMGVVAAAMTTASAASRAPRARARPGADLGRDLGRSVGEGVGTMSSVDSGSRAQQASVEWPIRPAPRRRPSSRGSGQVRRTIAWFIAPLPVREPDCGARAQAHVARSRRSPPAGPTAVLLDISSHGSRARRGRQDAIKIQHAEPSS